MSDLTTSPAVDLDLTPEVLAKARDIAFLEQVLGVPIEESALLLRSAVRLARYVHSRTLASVEESLAGATS